MILSAAEMPIFFLYVWVYSRLISVFLFQDDFEDLCETLVDFLGPAGHFNRMPSATAPASAIISSTPLAATAEYVVNPRPSMTAVSTAPTSLNRLSVSGSWDSELQRLASELRILAEEAESIRQDMKSHLKA